MVSGEAGRVGAVRSHVPPRSAGGGEELYPFRQAVMPLVFRKGGALGCCVEAGLEVPGWQQGSNPEAAL